MEKRKPTKEKRRGRQRQTTKNAKTANETRRTAGSAADTRRSHKRKTTPHNARQATRARQKPSTTHTKSQKHNVYIIRNKTRSRSSPLNASGGYSNIVKHLS